MRAAPAGRGQKWHGAPAGGELHNRGASRVTLSPPPPGSHVHHQEGAGGLLQGALAACAEEEPLRAGADVGAEDDQVG